MLIVPWSLCAQPPPSLQIHLAQGIPFTEAALQTGHVLVLEQGSDLQTWTESARALHALHPYGDWRSALERQRFFRLRTVPIQPTDDWSNQLAPATAELFKPGSGSGLARTSFAKFTILLSQPDRVFFQES